MLDINVVRQSPDKVKDSERRRGRDPAIVEQVLGYDEDGRKLLKDVEALKHQRNVVSEEINKAKKAKEEKKAAVKIKEMRAVADNIKQQEEVIASLFLQRNVALQQIGNILHVSVPTGKDGTENKELKKIGVIPQFTFPIKDHLELGLEL